MPIYAVVSEAKEEPIEENYPASQSTRSQMKMFSVTFSPVTSLAVDTFVIHQSAHGMKAKAVPRSLFTSVITQSDRKNRRRCYSVSFFALQTYS